MVRETPFRIWLQNMWFEHRDEVLETTGRACDYDLAHYFHKYKWWLRAVYKHEKRKQERL